MGCRTRARCVSTASQHCWTHTTYFRALQLWTKRGRSGFIKEPLGTHGYFKATFDGKINPLDAVAVSLYKRVWPRSASLWIPGQVVEEVEGMDMES